VRFHIFFGFDAVDLQESKLCSPTPHLLRYIGGTRINAWVVLDSYGASEGQLIECNGKFFEEISKVKSILDIGEA